MGGKWPYSGYFAKFWLQHLLKTARTIPVHFLSSFYSMHFARVQIVNPNSSTGIINTWKKTFISSEWLDCLRAEMESMNISIMNTISL